MGYFTKLAERRALNDFRVKFPGQRFDRTNREHTRFMEMQIKCHEDILENNQKIKNFQRGL